MGMEASQGIPVKLSPKEIECLNWAMEGKTSWEIGIILGRKENTVNYHIANIMDKLNVTTRQQAVIKALRLGLIQL